MMHLSVISLFPEMFTCLQYGITRRAIEKKLVQLDIWNPRHWASGPHQQVDDKPYGGGPGMVMMYEPLHHAILHAQSQISTRPKVIYLSPQGKSVQQADLNKIVTEQQSIIWVAGRYEGIDERLITHHIDEEWSLGDFVLSGGELAAMVYIDAIIRLLPGSLGDEESAQQDSFMNGLLEYPHYTRPAMVNNTKVPDVLMSGNHREIERWRRKQALGRTWLKRPDLLETMILEDIDKQLLIEFKSEEKQ